jgi:hypothetical protein
LRTFPIRRLLLLASLLLFIQSAWGSHYILGDNFGLLTFLPWTFYIAVFLALITFALGISGRCVGRLGKLSSIFLLNFYFASIGFFAGGTGGATVAYGNILSFMAGANYAMSTSLSSLVQHGGGRFLWPFATLLLITIFRVFNLNGFSFGLVASLGTVSFTLLDCYIVYLIAGKVFRGNSDTALLVAVSYIFFQIAIPSQFDDIGISYTLFLSLLLVLFIERKRTIGLYVTLLFLAVSLVLCNFYASLLGFAFLSAFALWKRGIGILLTYLGILLSWLGYGFTTQASELYVTFISGLLKVGSLLRVVTSVIRVGSPQHHAVVLAQAFLYMIPWILTFVNVGLLFLGKSKSLDRQFRLLLSAPLIMGLFTLAVGPSFGTNIIDSLNRLTFGAFPLLLLTIFWGNGIKITSARKWLLPFILILIILTPINILSTYGDLPLTYMSTSQQIAGMYMQNHFFGGILLDVQPDYFTIPGINTFFFYTNLAFIINNSLQEVTPAIVFQSLQKTTQNLLIPLGAEKEADFSALTGTSRDYVQTVNKINNISDLIYSNGQVQSNLIQGAR